MAINKQQQSRNNVLQTKVNSVEESFDSIEKVDSQILNNQFDAEKIALCNDNLIFSQTLSCLLTEKFSCNSRDLYIKRCLANADFLLITDVFKKAIYLLANYADLLAKKILGNDIRDRQREFSICTAQMYSFVYYFISMALKCAERQIDCKVLYLDDFPTFLISIARLYESQVSEYVDIRLYRNICDSYNIEYSKADKMHRNIIVTLANTNRKFLASLTTVTLHDSLSVFINDVLYFDVLSKIR